MSASSKKKLRKEQAAGILTEKQQQELAEAKKLRNITTAFVVIMLVVALTAVGILGTRAVNNSGIIDRNVIAAVTGEHKLNSIQMNYYLTDTINNMYQQWQSAYGESTSMYLSMMGLDPKKPLNEQVHNQETGETWADHFLTEALEKAKSDYALYDKAIAENFKLSEEEQEMLDSSNQMMSLYAQYYGYGNVKQYLRSMYGYGASEKSYAEYTRIATIASAYYTKYRDSLSYDNTAIRSQDEKNPAAYCSYTFSSYYLSSSLFLEGGTKDDKGNTTYSEDEKNTAVKKAEEVANSLLGAKDTAALDAAIAALEINKDKKDAKSTFNDNVLYSQVLTPLQSWVGAKERTTGEMTVITNETTTKDADGKETKTINGYYVVYFQSRNENTRPLANVRHLLVQFEGGTTDANGNKIYSDTEKATAKAEAERLLQVWKDGKATEDSFIELVKEHSDDGSKESGGLFEDIHPASQYVPSFLAWSLDTARKPGDTGVIVSEYGYHVMYYVRDDEMTYRDYMISEELREKDVEEWFNGIVDKATITAENTKRLNLDSVLSAAS